MKYMLLVCGDAELMPDDVLEQGCGGWSEEMQRRGVLQGGAGLRPPDEAATVRVRKDEVLLTDGPFAETKEQIGGFSLIECKDLDEALEVASKHPAAKYGAIEVRPLWQ